MPISLGFWEWGCPKCGDAHITVTVVFAKGPIVYYVPGGGGGFGGGVQF